MSASTVRLIDDDDGVRRALTFVLEVNDLKVRSYGSALELLESSDGLPGGCIITDVRMA